MSIGLAFVYAHYAHKPTATISVANYGDRNCCNSCCIRAHYEAWKIERDKYDEEVEKNGKPEIRGTALRFQYRQEPDS